MGELQCLVKQRKRSACPHPRGRFRHDRSCSLETGRLWTAKKREAAKETHEPPPRMSPNLRPIVFGLKVRTRDFRSSFFVRTFSLFTSWWCSVWSRSALREERRVLG